MSASAVKSSGLAPPRRRRRQVALAAAALATALAAGLAWGEWQGWPLLARPLAQRLTGLLGRPVSLDPQPGVDQGPVTDTFRLQLLGQVQLHLPQLTVAAPAWATDGPLLAASDVDLVLRYGELWRAWRGLPWQVQQLHAGTLVARLQRQADGRASWHADDPAPTGVPQRALPTVASLMLRDGGRLHWRDAVQDLQLEVNATMAAQPRAEATPGHLAAAGSAAQAASAASAARPASPASAAAGADDGAAPLLLQAQALGRYRGLPVQARLQAWAPASLWGGSVTPIPAGPSVAGPRPMQPVRLDLRAGVGRANLRFDGGLDDVAGLQSPAVAGADAWQGLAGRFSLDGPSLAAVGDPLGVTLPTTRAFKARGRLRHAGDTWYVVVDDAQVGRSRLRGDFSYAQRAGRPLLAGRLSGPRLLLADLGPAVGVPTETPARAGKRLPDRPFDLAALRGMDANVLVDIAELDLDTAYLTPLRPLHAHLQLKAGVLDIGALDARAGQGRLHGSLQLDGRLDTAALRSDLRWEGLRLEQWIHQDRDPGQPPWVSGTVQGSARLQGRGNSTAAILAQLAGQVQAGWRNGRISHLAVEAAGLDLAQALGVMLRGDDALTVHCAAADLVAERGVFRPRLMVVDSGDSTLLLDGSVSLASEAIDLRVIVSPRDFSPLALRAPLRLRGSLADPQVSIDGGALAGRLGLAALLAMVNPLAGLLPLLDAGDGAAAGRDADGCRSLERRLQRRAGPAPAAAR